MAIEHGIEALYGIGAAAVVGVGPIGTQQIVAVVTLDPPTRKPSIGDLALHDRIRHALGSDALGNEIASVLVVPELPVDRRHNSKVDRAAVADWAGSVLSGAA